MTATSVATGWWVYGVVPADADVAALEQSVGVASTAVRLVRSGGLAAVAGEVPLDEFDEDALRRNLEDLAWLEAQALAHDRVLLNVLGSAPLVPLRFGAVYRTEGRVRLMLEQRAAELEAALARLAGRVELGVKGYVAETEAEPPGASSGREYMVRKQQERRLAAEAASRAHDLARSVHEQLSALADEARANPPQPAELSGRREHMILNAAYLVAAERADELAHAVTALRAKHERDGLELELTGPWPPYNFAHASA